MLELPYSNREAEGSVLRGPFQPQKQFLKLRCVKQLKKKRNKKEKSLEMLPFLNVLHPRQVNARKATPFSLPPVPPSIRCVELRSAPGFPSSRAVPLAARCPLPPHTASRALHSRTRDSVRANARTRRATVAGPALPRGSRLPPSLSQHLPRVPPPPPGPGPGLLQQPGAVAAPPTPRVERAAASRGTGGRSPGAR